MSREYQSFKWRLRLSLVVFVVSWAGLWFLPEYLFNVPEIRKWIAEKFVFFAPVFLDYLWQPAVAGVLAVSTFLLTPKLVEPVLPEFATPEASIGTSKVTSYEALKKDSVSLQLWHDLTESPTPNDFDTEDFQRFFETVIVTNPELIKAFEVVRPFMPRLINIPGVPDPIRDELGIERLRLNSTIIVDNRSNDAIHIDLPQTFNGSVPSHGVKLPAGWHCEFSLNLTGGRTTIESGKNATISLMCDVSLQSPDGNIENWATENLRAVQAFTSTLRARDIQCERCDLIMLNGRSIRFYPQFAIRDQLPKIGTPEIDIDRVSELWDIVRKAFWKYRARVVRPQ